jgi:hypothetical protein
MKSKLTLLPLFVASVLLAQETRPTALQFEAVPPNTSPRETIVFKNIGDTPLTVTVSIPDPPFVLVENRCANGVKGGSHCNIYLTYMPSFVGAADNGSVHFNFGQGVTSAGLIGHGVSAIKTTAKIGRKPNQCSIVNLGGGFSMIAKVWVVDKYYALPTAEQVHASCTNGQENVDLGSATLTLCKGKGCPSGPYDQAPFAITPDQTGNWSCQVTYDGDGVLGGAVDSVNFQIVDGGGHCH